MPVAHERIDASRSFVDPISASSVSMRLAGSGARINDLIYMTLTQGFTSLQKVCDLSTRSCAGGRQGCPTAPSKADSWSWASVCGNPLTKLQRLPALPAPPRVPSRVPHAGGWGLPQPRWPPLGAVPSRQAEGCARTCRRALTRRHRDSPRPPPSSRSITPVPAHFASVPGPARPAGQPPALPSPARRHP